MSYTVFTLFTPCPDSNANQPHLSTAGVTNMQPTKEFRAAREAFRRDQQT